MTRLPFFMIIILSFWCLSCLVSTSHETWAGESVNCQTQYEFAEYLFNENDFFRAISEYKRFIFLCPDNPLCETCHFRICESYYHAERWNDAVESLEKFLTSYPDSSRYLEALYLMGSAEKCLQRYDDALSSFSLLTEVCTSEEMRNRGYIQSALIHVDRENWPKARELFLKVSEKSVLYPSSWIFASGLEHIETIPQKSPALAGILAAVVPGAGHLYVERPRDALVAFLLNGAFIFAAIELFEDDNYVAGGVVTFFELGWYTGNIYSAISSSHKYNKRAKDEFIHVLKEKSNLSYHYDKNDDIHILMYSMNF